LGNPDAALAPIVNDKGGIFHETDFVLAWVKANLFVRVRRFGVTILREVWSIDTMFIRRQQAVLRRWSMNGGLGADLCRARQIFGG
jgi:hypothetical protein